MQRKRGRDGSMWHPTVTGCLHLCRNVLRGMPKIRNARRPISQGRGTYQSASVTGSLLGRNCDDGSIEAGKCCRGWQLGGRQGNALSHMDGRQGSSNHRQERSEEHTSELQSLMRISYAVFCLKKKTKKNQNNSDSTTLT